MPFTIPTVHFENSLFSQQQYNIKNVIMTNDFSFIHAKVQFWGANIFGLVWAESPKGQKRCWFSVDSQKLLMDESWYSNFWIVIKLQKHRTVYATIVLS